jgi:phage replication-related protein YjqB (UPF0714/DUF867 family)
MAHRDRYRSYDELAAAHREGIDFRVHALHRGSGVAIIAPHGGRIERGTSEIARAIAGEDFDLYLFEGCLPSLQFRNAAPDQPSFRRATLPVDDFRLPYRRWRYTAWPTRGSWPCWADGMLCWRVRWPISMYARGVRARISGHRYPGRDARNLCNRGAKGAGVQIELSDRLRGGLLEPCVIDAVRRTLHARATEGR